MPFRFTPARFRLLVQAVFAAVSVSIGVRFLLFLAWATGQSDTFFPRPASVEAFLPISALLGWRQWVSTGVWDAIHPAGLTLFIAFITMAFLFRKGFCGYLCPVGFVSSLLDRLGRATGLAKIPPKWMDYPLTGLKYAVLGFFLYSVFFAMDLRTVQTFLTAPYNMAADANLLGFFTNPSTLSLTVIGCLALFSLVVRNAWCRYLCPYGALLGIFSWLSPVAVERDDAACIHCGKCTRGCPAGIDVQGKNVVRTPECIGCAECVGQCPVDNCLRVAVAGRRIPWIVMGLGCAAILFAFWLWAVMTGHWQSDVPVSMLQRIYGMNLR